MLRLYGFQSTEDAPSCTKGTCNGHSCDYWVVLHGMRPMAKPPVEVHDFLGLLEEYWRRRYFGILDGILSIKHMWIYFIDSECTWYMMVGWWVGEASTAKNLGRIRDPQWMVSTRTGGQMVMTHDDPLDFAVVNILTTDVIDWVVRPEFTRVNLLTHVNPPIFAARVPILQDSP